jgi:hypothetical protein
LNISINYLNLRLYPEEIHQFHVFATDNAVALLNTNKLRGL